MSNELHPNKRLLNMLTELRNSGEVTFYEIALACKSIWYEVSKNMSAEDLAKLGLGDMVITGIDADDFGHREAEMFLGTMVAIYGCDRTYELILLHLPKE